MDDRGSACMLDILTEPLIQPNHKEGKTRKESVSKSSTPECRSPSGVKVKLKTQAKKLKQLNRLAQGRRRVEFSSDVEVKRPAEMHSFLTEVTDVRQMEQGLLTLLQHFHSGKLQAFGNECTMQQMEAIREQQEKLAKLHFELGGGRDLSPDLSKPLSDKGLHESRDNMNQLVSQLQLLSEGIERLHGTDE